MEMQDSIRTTTVWQTENDIVGPGHRAGTCKDGNRTGATRCDRDDGFETESGHQGA